MSDLILVARIPANDSGNSEVGLIRLNRPKALNALSQSLIQQLLSALQSFDKDPRIGAVILTGSESVFAAGADIKELKDLTFIRAYMGNFLQSLCDGVAAIRKPIIAVVQGFALGGGCELAMMCDMIYAAENATFGQPEVKIGTIPGAGGTQRLLRAVGKAKAMHMILTGETLSAADAERAGLVSKVLPTDKVLEAAIETAQKIASYSAPIVSMAKEAVHQAEELHLSEGIRFERRLYHSTFATLDSKEGMIAFVEKRNAAWTHS